MKYLNLGDLLPGDKFTILKNKYNIYPDLAGQIFTVKSVYGKDHWFEIFVEESPKYLRFADIDNEFIDIIKTHHMSMEISDLMPGDKIEIFMDIFWTGYYHKSIKTIKKIESDDYSSTIYFKESHNNTGFGFLKEDKYLFNTIELSI